MKKPKPVKPVAKPRREIRQPEPDSVLQPEQQPAAIEPDQALDFVAAIARLVLELVQRGREQGFGYSEDDIQVLIKFVGQIDR